MGMDRSQATVGTVAWLLLVSLFVSGCEAELDVDKDVGRAQAAIGSGEDHSFPVGSLIIPMDTTYQDRGMFRAFGLVYRLLQNGVPVSWVIRRGKTYGSADFTTSSTNFATGAAIASHGYRGGPFVIDATNAAVARPLITAWRTTYPDTTVHVTTAAFTGYIRAHLVAAPDIAMFADGNQDIARGYMQAAGIPDSTGSTAWANTSPDMLDPTEVAGPTTTNHHDGKLFDADGQPTYCQMMSMHWAVSDANRPQGQEVVAEYREYLRFPTHLFAECQAVNAIENNVNGHFLTPNGFVIGAQPSNASLQFFNADLPFAQMDGSFDTTGGSEPSYSLPAGDAFLDDDVVMISGGTAGTGTQDVWMTGFVGGACSILSESCDPALSQGKVSYLGGHSYDDHIPITTNPDSQGTRLFLNSLFEAPCATDIGQPSVTIYKAGPTVVTSNTVTWTMTYANAGPGIARAATITDMLPAGTTFVSATGGGTLSGTTVTWSLGTLAAGESGVVTVTVRLGAFGTFANTARLTYRAGLTPFTVTSGTFRTCYHAAGDLTTCAGSGMATARDCGDGADNDRDGLVDYPADPGCHSVNDDDETDPVGMPSNIDARLLVVFDTSGSMNWNTCTSDFTGGDGSAECPGSDVACATCSSTSCGNGDADDSRLDRARNGLSDAVTAFGEVEYALMRFHQVPVGFSCPTRNANRQSGAWLGAGASPCSGFDSGDVIVSFDRDNVEDLLEWTDGSSNHPMSNPPPGEDYELRGTGNTPLAGSLASALTYMTGVEAADRAGGCRPYVVVLITDGIETCGGNAVTRAMALRSAGYPVYVIGFAVNAAADVAQLDAIAAAGGTTEAIVVDDSTSLSAALASIVESSVLVETCNGADDDCDTRVDEGFTLYCNRPTVTTASLCTDPGETVCNGIDDNCDGRVDEGLRNRCGACGALPIETCNLIDDDCDGPIDEGVCAGCVPDTELCDGLDNDCDSRTDEGITRPCGTDVGACTVGLETCSMGAFGACSGIGPTTETCNGTDDDCDGVIDGLTRSCGSAIGACTPGVETCTAGTFGACVGGRSATTEICNGIDDDCDSSTDEGNPGGGAICGSSIGACTRGAIACSGGVLTCTGGTPPSPETCNLADDDCDGAIDDGVPPGGACGACGGGLLRCVAGNMECVGDRVPGSEVCNGADDDCDMRIDEGDPGAGEPCGDDTGECTIGTTACIDGRLECSGVGPTAELCNMRDDDCDGVVDDGLSVGAPCGSAVGECEPGVTVCRDGATVCDGALGEQPELCNGLDDDCDGEVDDGIALGDECGETEGACEPGQETCVRGAVACVGEIPRRTEACDCEDNDCDGEVDEAPTTGTLCPGDSVCLDCACALPCTDSEFVRCPGGSVERIVDGQCYCVPDACDDDTCAGSTVMDDDGVVCAPDAAEGVPACACVDNECTFPCSGVSCPSPTICNPSSGRCVENSCRGLGCPDGQYCDPASRECLDHPCDDVSCDDGQACRAGDCEPSCGTVSCAMGARCHAGVCEDDACVGVRCESGEACVDGDCVADPCRGVTCGAGEVCDRTTRMCAIDPCTLLRCPAGETCVEGECAGRTAMPDGGMDASDEDGGERPETGAPREPTRVLAAGAGGCTCSVPRAGGRAGGWLLVAIGIGILLLRRRARLAAIAALVASGCSVEPYCFDCLEDAGDAEADARSDREVPDARPFDASEQDADADDIDGGECLADELCNERDDDCDGEVDEGIDTMTDERHCGGCDRTCAPPHAFGECTEGQCHRTGCDVGYVDIDDDDENGCEYRCLASAEDDVACDYRDDDCDGEVDEDTSFDDDALNCGRDMDGRGRCGHVCRAPRADGSCIDGACVLGDCEPGFFDRDGDADNGCEYRCTPSSPATEVCNLRDDDCNGMTDEGDPGGGPTCGTDDGECRRGTLRCVAGELVCMGEIAPTTELCNLLDDDCDGDADEGNPEGGTFCGVEEGRCSVGMQRCVMGELVCDGAIEATDETCDGTDEDCDGRVDEGDPGGGPSCGSGTGACARGVMHCRGGVLACEGASEPTPELCNETDDDCDTRTDEGFSLMTDARNCGSCGTICTFDNAITQCALGTCGIAACRPGFVDQDMRADTGCEYACSIGGAEACNGRDDDCDRRIDEALTPPASFCNPNGVCSGTRATCGGASGWRCSYPSTFEATEARCDTLDNDCDGRVDEAFPRVGTACGNGSGACRRTGTFVCNATNDDVRCTAAAAGTPTDEGCDNIDNDCDGSVDERTTDDPTTTWRDGIDLSAFATVTMPRPGGGTMRIMRYEASHPDASASAAGGVETLACSRAGVLPWTNLTWTEARDACCTLNSDGECVADAEVGWRLCPSPEWEAACEGPTTSCEWAYSSTCSTSQPLVCNGREYDCQPSMPGDQDCLAVTGAPAFPQCRADWGAAGSVFDMSGNAREWTATAQAPGIYELRGGAYTNIEDGRRCSFAFAAAGDTFAHPNTGFRCCYY